MLAFKRSGIIGLVAALAIAMAGCGSTGSGKSACSSGKEKPTDLSGQWIQKDADSDSYQAGVVSDDTITIYWVSDGGQSQSLYWAGSYKAPTKQVKEYSWTSEADHSQTDSALLASGDDTKDFTYKNGEISYEASAFGTTKTMVLKRNTDSSKTVKATGKTESEQPTVADSGYTMTKSGDDPYLDYGIKITNPNQNTITEMPTIKITGKFSDGTVLFSENQTISDIMPGETVAWGDSIDCNGKTPDTVEFSASTDSFKLIEDKPTLPRFTLNNITEQKGGFTYSVTGEITNNTSDKTSAAITVLLKNNGQIVGGYTSFTDNEIDPNGSTVFEADSLTEANNIPQHTEIEVTAQPW